MDTKWFKWFWLGVIKLKDNIGEKTGWFGVYLSILSLKGSNVDITGYPGEKNATMWKMNGDIIDAPTYTLSYKIDTTPG